MDVMSRQKRSSEGEQGRLGRLFRSTVLLALVFSAGLITGQRILNSSSDGSPFIALSATAATAVKATPKTAATQKPEFKFSFYEQLGTQDGAPVVPPAAPTAAPQDDHVEVSADLVASVAQALKQPEAAEGARYTIQVSSHPSRAMATRELARMRAMGLDAHIVAAETDGARFYRVRVGKFGTLEQVNAELARFQAEGKVQGFVTPF